MNFSCKFRRECKPWFKVVCHSFHAMLPWILLQHCSKKKELHRSFKCREPRFESEKGWFWKSYTHFIQIPCKSKSCWKIIKYFFCRPPKKEDATPSKVFIFGRIPLDPKPWNMKALNPQYMGCNPLKNEGNVGSHGSEDFKFPFLFKQSHWGF